ncbi:ABC transporter permease [Parasalinivibrio latis]|uniref:ABC transporter permease n=1 Tax=Parasalinivibrio latis TaxID=2952610 RepID=UPI0030E5D469
MSRETMRDSLIQTSTRLILQLILVVALAWGLLALSPLDPITAYLNGNLFGIAAGQKAEMAAKLGLDTPLWQQFSQWLVSLAHGDMGFSNLYRQPVTEVIRERVGMSLLLIGLVWLFSLAVGFTLGLIAGVYRNRLPDLLIRSVAWLLTSIPSFWLGMILISLFSVTLKWMPVCCAAPFGSTFTGQGFGSLISHLVLPVSTLTLVYMAPIVLHTREKVADVLDGEPLLYSRLHGQSPLALTRFHIIKNSLVPAVILQFASFAELFSGSILAETVFNFPGLGQTLVKAGMADDTALLLGGTLITAVMVFIGNLAASAIALRLTPGENP